ncbi:hypothetical protein G6011_02366 [Alternaria panax]|uniref:Uncharacterized protein n=1 Tax=Alternaria panax TaxID=48097 RepID=A0AAD4I777_9PLEO|nr:hypothetical protein G6011_02366 [Alternaria panax]
MAQPLAAEVAGSADEASPHSPPTNLATKAFCKNCKNNIGDFYNSWFKVTGSYYVPALLGSYSSTLRPMAKIKAASMGTELAGCGRDFFKLGRIELQCEIAMNQFIVVEPKLDTSSDLLANEDTPSPSSSIATPNASSAEATEIDSCAPSVEYGDQTRGRYEQSQNRDIQQQQQQQQQQQPREPIEGSMHSVVAPPQRHSPSIQHRSYVMAQNIPGDSLQSPSLHHQGAYESHKESSVDSSSGQLEAPTVTPQNQSAIETPQTNGHHYPRSPKDVGVDAMVRLQTQMSQNSGALAAHSRDIRIGQETVGSIEETIREFQTKFIRQSTDIQRIEALTARLQNEVQGMRHAMESINHELQANRMQRQSVSSDVPPAAQSSAMELLARQLHDVSHKTSDLDNLKLHVEIMKDKIYRLEERAGHELSQLPPHVNQAPQVSVAQSSQPALAAATSHQSTPIMTPSSRAPQPIPNGQSQQTLFGASSTTAAAPSVQPTSSQASGWATVNAGVKRAYHNGVETLQGGNAHAPEPPKRPRLVDDDTLGYTAPQVTPLTNHHFQTPTHVVSSQHTVPESTHGSQSQKPYHVPYTTQDGPSDASWQPESQRIIEHRPRGRPRGSGGSGSRGGRGRKSMPAQVHDTLGTPEWERDDWQGVPDSQTSPAGYYSLVGQPGRGGIARRGSGGGGGGGRGGYATSDRASSLGLQGVTSAMSFGSPGDPYGSGKKTRTKPIRNADGVLIRKDGRPDMRSQSSAANLRKVHERKDGQASHSPTCSSFTPANLQYAASAHAPDTPSPSGYAADLNATDKHNAIMGKIFPDGIDAARKKQDYTRQVFEENRDHTVHVRSQNSGPTIKTAVQIKKEQVDRNRISETRSPQERDVDVDMDMDGTEDHADDERQTPDESSSYAGGGIQLEKSQTQDATMQESSSIQAASHTVLETQAVDSSVTIGAGSAQTQ